MSRFSVDLWFDNNAEEAIGFYTSVFDNSKVLSTAYYGKDMPGPEGQVMYIEFELDGQRFGAVNGGPHFTFNPAVSIVISCNDQEEVDRYYDALSANPDAEQCGWLADKYGLAWQVVPTRLTELMRDSDPEVVERVNRAVLGMKRLNIDLLEKAAIG